MLQGVAEADPKVCPDCCAPLERVLGRLGRNWQTDKRFNETRTNADYRRMGMKRFRKVEGGYEREA